MYILVFRCRKPTGCVVSGDGVIRQPPVEAALVMAALQNRASHYKFCPVVSFFLLFLLSYYPPLISAVADWMSTMLLHMV